MNKSDGGPAFPTDHSVDAGFTDIKGGMSMLDYFAAKAMQALIAREPIDSHRAEEDSVICGLDKYDIAHTAYMIAEGMLAEREKW